MGEAQPLKKKELPHSLASSHQCSRTPPAPTSAARRASPSSAMAAYRGARRALRDYGAHLPCMHKMAAVLKGLRAKFIADFGDEALAPRQAAPFAQSSLDGMLAAVIQRRVPGLTSGEAESMQTALPFCINTGARKAELPRYRRSNLTWRDANKRIVVPDAEGLSRAGWLEVAPVCSKTDPSNVQWGATRMWFRVDADDLWSVAHHLLLFERAHPCEPEARARMPLFFDPAQPPAAFGLPRLTSMMNAMLLTVMSATQAADYRWHSCRRTLACKLRKLKMPWDRIQSMLRWKSPDSVHTYGAIDADDYAADVEAALRADASGIRNDDLPPLDPTAALGDINDTLAEIAAEGRGAGTKTGASAVAPEDKPEARRRRAPTSTAAPPPLELADFDLGEKGVVSGARRDT